MVERGATPLVNGTRGRAKRFTSRARRAAGRLRRALRRAVLATGSRVECPCCGRSFRSFLPAGPHRRPNAECPACGSRERHRLLWLFIRDQTDLLSAPARLLHFAPEPTLLRRLGRAGNLDHVTADLDSPLADHHVDIADLPFEDASFDRVICVHVLEHVDDDRRAMRELRRVLRPDGQAIVMVPAHWGIPRTLEDPELGPAERLARYGHPDHRRLYGRDCVERLREAGFEVEVRSYAEELGAAADRHVLTGERIYVCRPAAPSA